MATPDPTDMLATLLARGLIHGVIFDGRGGYTLINVDDTTEALADRVVLAA
jgi:hypothetical protein